METISSLHRHTYERAHLLAARRRLNTTRTNVEENIQNALPPRLYSLIRRQHRPPPDHSAARCLLAPPRLTAHQTQQTPLSQQTTKTSAYCIAHVNARSLAPRLNEVCHLIQSEGIEILCISETWLSDNVLDGVLIVPGYTLHRCDRPGGRRGGGVAMLLSNELRATRLHDTSSDSNDGSGVEALWLSVGGARRATVTVGAFYRPPGALKRSTVGLNPISI